MNFRQPTDRDEEPPLTSHEIHAVRELVLELKAGRRIAVFFIRLLLAIGAGAVGVMTFLDHFYHVFRKE